MNSIPSYFFKVHFNIMFPTDYILVKQRFKNSIKDVKTLPGEDTDSDCHLLVAKICTRLNQITWFRKGKPRRVGKVVCSVTKSALEKSRNVRYIWLGKSRGEQWSHKLHRKITSKMDDEGHGRMLTMKEGRNNYKILTNELKRATDKARGKYLDSICAKVTEFQIR